LILDKETGSPIINTTITVRLGTNEEVAVKTNQFGEFRLANLPSQVKLSVSANSYKSITVSSATYKKQIVGIVIELEKKSEEWGQILSLPEMEFLLLHSVPLYGYVSV
jgi:carboxypeptidase family protein